MHQHCVFDVVVHVSLFQDGARRFGILLENRSVAPAVDIFSVVGKDKPLALQFLVNVSVGCVLWSAKRCISGVCVRT